MSRGEQRRLLPESGDEAGAAAHAGQSTATCGAELRVVGGAQVGKFVLFPVGPDVFHRVQLRRVRWQESELDVAMQRIEEVANQAAAVHRQAVPDNQHPSPQAAPQLAEEVHHLLPSHRARIQLEVKVPGSESGHRRQLLPVEVVLQDRRLAARRPGAAAVRALAQSAFIDEDERPPLPLGFFFSVGQVSRFHRAMRSSSRSRARPTGRCGLQPRLRSSRHTWPGW